MLHILVIDDDELFRNMLCTMLAKENHKVSSAKDGKEGLQLIQQIKPDLIITDILMPNMDGIELIQAIRSQGISIPIIAVSGGRRTVTAEFNLASAEMMGVKATLPKPFDRATLRQTIEQAMR
jgi:CheY-like chemotaxis protein